jgi:hypothetical protein
MGALDQFYGVCELGIYLPSYLKLVDGQRKQAELVVYEEDENLLLAINVSAELMERYAAVPCPSEKLSEDNIGLLAVFAEEISHLRHIIKWGSIDEKVSRFDLELQSEFDKVIVATELAEKQYDNHEFQPILRMILDHSHAYTDDAIYHAAENLAGHWWWSLYDAYGETALEQIAIRQYLKELSEKRGQHKMEFLQQSISQLKNRRRMAA